MFNKLLVIAALFSIPAFAADEIYELDVSKLPAGMTVADFKDSCFTKFSVKTGGDLAYPFVNSETKAGAKVVPIQKSEYTTLENKINSHVLTKVYVVSDAPYAQYTFGTFTRMELEIKTQLNGKKEKTVTLKVEAINHRESAEVQEGLFCDGLVYKKK